jgi:hypothetical protein
MIGAGFNNKLDPKHWLQTVLRIRIRDPVSFWPLDLGSGMGGQSASGSGMNNPDHIFKSLETIFLVFWGLKKNT